MHLPLLQHLNHCELLLPVGGSILWVVFEYLSSLDFSLLHLVFEFLNWILVNSGLSHSFLLFPHIFHDWIHKGFVNPCLKQLLDQPLV